MADSARATPRTLDMLRLDALEATADPSCRFQRLDFHQNRLPVGDETSVALHAHAPARQGRAVWQQARWTQLRRSGFATTTAIQSYSRAQVSHAQLADSHTRHRQSGQGRPPAKSAIENSKFAAPQFGAADLRATRRSIVNKWELLNLL